MTNDNVNFDELAQKSFAPGAGEADYERLFAAAFSLAEWHFIAVGEMPNLSPYCAFFPDFFGDQPAVAVFTDTGRARKFMAESSTEFGSKDKPINLDYGNLTATISSENLILSVPTDNILDYIEKLIPKGIVKIFFNPNKDSHGFSNDLKIMRPIREHLESKNLLTKTETEKVKSPVEVQPPEEISNEVNFDALSLKAAQTNAREDLNAMFGAVFALPEWLFISRGEMPNVYPYVASNAQYANGQPMIRAFTDNKRLIRFARENNLTKADGSCDSLAIPTANIVEYIEGFIAQGAFGIWFNSDTESEGFFAPIKQLRPIKEHLDRLNMPPKSVSKTALLIVQDGLGFPSGFVSEAGYKLNIFCRLPSDWTDGTQIKPEAREKIFEFLYGANWRMGNNDGSRYVVIDSFSKIFDDETVKNTRREGTKNTDEDHYRFYLVEADGTIRSVTAEEFQADIDAEFKTSAVEEARENQDRLAGLGLSQNADSDFEQNLNLNMVGSVSFETSIAPFYEAIVPLLKDFQGTGDYMTLLRFEDGGKSEQVENIAENAHGAYLQIRRFIYHNPKNNVRIGVNSIHSNSLRHVQSNAELIVSFELCKNLDNQTAAFYHRFEGPKSEVFKLSAAIQPILEASGYQAVS